MIAVLNKAPLTFDEFMEWYPENSEYRYELRRGIVEVVSGASHFCHPEWNGVERRISILPQDRDSSFRYRYVALAEPLARTE